MQLVSNISKICGYDEPTSHTDRLTDGQTDDMQSQYRDLHIVHRAVKPVEVRIMQLSPQSSPIPLVFPI